MDFGWFGRGFVDCGRFLQQELTGKVPFGTTMQPMLNHRILGYTWNQTRDFQWSPFRCFFYAFCVFDSFAMFLIFLQYLNTPDIRSKKIVLDFEILFEKFVFKSDEWKAKNLTPVGKIWKQPDQTVITGPTFLSGFNEDNTIWKHMSCALFWLY